MECLIYIESSTKQIMEDFSQIEECITKLESMYDDVKPEARPIIRERIEYTRHACNVIREAGEAIDEYKRERGIA